MTSHESLPAIAVGSNRGRVHILLMVDPKMPKMLQQFYLCVGSIQYVQFVSGKNDLIVNSNWDIFVIVVSIQHNFIKLTNF